MKKTILFSLMLFCLSMNAQSWGLTGNSGTIPGTNFIGTIDNKDFIFKTNNIERIKVSSSGNIGFNKNNPTAAIDIIGDTKLKSDLPNKDVVGIFNDGDNVDAGIDLLFLRYGKYQPNNPSVMTVSGMTTPTKYEAFFNLRANGKLGLGTYNFQTCSDCSNYRLYVKDGIKTEKVKVEIAAENGWADYVFDSNYKLMSLRELEAYIAENKHLPEVPTTEEAINNGIELKEMNILLLKKVEELTLHVIELNNKLENQNEKIKILESK